MKVNVVLLDILVWTYFIKWRFRQKQYIANVLCKTTLVKNKFWSFQKRFCLVLYFFLLLQGNYPDTPYGVTVPVISNADCNTSYGGDIYDDMMCLGYLGTGGKDSCQVGCRQLFCGLQTSLVASLSITFIMWPKVGWSSTNSERPSKFCRIFGSNYKKFMNPFDEEKKFEGLWIKVFNFYCLDTFKKEANVTPFANICYLFFTK